MTGDETLMNSVTDLIEEVAEAIYDAYTAGLNRHDAPPWLGMTTAEQVQWRAMARIAVTRTIRLMRGER